MKRKTKKWIKNHLNLYNLSIIGLVLIIMVSLAVIFRQNIKSGLDDISTNIATQIKEKQKITEEEARKVAVEEFKKLGEQDIQESDLKVSEIDRNGKKFYYIVSDKNRLEILISTGKVIRINSVEVE